MTLRLRVHVDEDGNAVVPLGKSLHGRDVDVCVEIVDDSTVTRADDGGPVEEIGSQDDDAFRRRLASFKPARPPKPVPRTFTEAEKIRRLAEFDAITGAWEGEFYEPADPPPDSRP